MASGNAAAPGIGLEAQRPPRLLFSTLLPYLLIVPAVLMLLVITVYPLLYSLRISFYLFRFGKADEFVGLDQYVQLFKDGNFWGSLLVTVVFAVVVVTVEFCLGLGLALLLATELRFRWLFRTGLMLPMVVMPVVVGIAWRLIFISNAGPVDSLARMVLGSPFNFLSNPGLALPAIMIVDIWNWTPFMMLVLLAGVQSLPLEPFEAARVDGASRWQVFRDLTLPMLRPVILVALLIRAMDAFTVFDQVYIMTNGGPGRSTEVMSLYVYRTAFKFSQLGYAAVLVFAMLVILVATSLALMRLLRGRDAVA